MFQTTNQILYINHAQSGFLVPGAGKCLGRSGWAKPPQKVTVDSAMMAASEGSPSSGSMVRSGGWCPFRPRGRATAGDPQSSSIWTGWSRSQKPCMSCGTFMTMETLEWCPNGFAPELWISCDIPALKACSSNRKHLQVIPPSVFMKKIIGVDICHSLGWFTMQCMKTINNLVGCNNGLKLVNWVASCQTSF